MADLDLHAEATGQEPRDKSGWAGSLRTRSPRNVLLVARTGVILAIVLVSLLGLASVLKPPPAKPAAPLEVNGATCGTWDVWSDAAPASPGPDTHFILDVDGSGPTDLWAVGYRRDDTNDKEEEYIVIAHWDGSVWRYHHAPDLGPDTRTSNLTDVEAISAGDVWAVGSRNGRPLAIHWDGRAWEAVPVPEIDLDSPVAASELNSVSALSSTDVWAVGKAGGVTLTMHWNGIEWSLVESPSPGHFGNALYTVNAVRSDSVWAAGYRGLPTGSRSLIMHWNGSKWTVVDSPNVRGSTDPNQSTVLYTFTMISDQDIWALGSSQAYTSDETVAMHWDGKLWSLVESPNDEADSTFLASTVTHTGELWALGLAGPHLGAANKTVAAIWKDGSWITVPSPQSFETQGFAGAVALSNGELWAVGTAEGKPLAARFTRHPCREESGSD